MQRLRNITLMISIILWATLLGGIVYSHVVFFPVYLSALPDSAVLVHAPYALNDSRFWLLIHPVTILMLALTLVLNWNVKPRRFLIGITCATYALALIVTTLYFVPELQAFFASPDSSVSRAEWFARGQRWQHLSWVRGAFMYLAFIPLLLAWRQSSRT